MSRIFFGLFSAAIGFCLYITYEGLTPYLTPIVLLMTTFVFSLFTLHKEFPVPTFATKMPLVVGSFITWGFIAYALWYMELELLTRMAAFAVVLTLMFFITNITDGMVLARNMAEITRKIREPLGGPPTPPTTVEVKRTWNSEDDEV